MPNALATINKIAPVNQVATHNEENIIVCSNQVLLDILTILKLDINYQYNLLSCISGVDLLGGRSRFCVAYDLLSLVHNSRIRVKVFVNESTSLESIVPLFPCANWWEREVWDMYGIYFQSHPDLRRILTDYGFEGYPLRKDFPLSGYTEVRYDALKQRVVIEPIQLAQESRIFEYDTQW